MKNDGGHIRGSPGGGGIGGMPIDIAPASVVVAREGTGGFKRAREGTVCIRREEDVI